MGVNLSDIVPSRSVELTDLEGRTVAVDAYNAIYQFLSVIRQPDGSPLKDSEGRVTSHMSGLLYRNVNLLEAGILPAYVFDGIPSELKGETVAERSERRSRAEEEWQRAREKGDLRTAFSKATQSSRITNDVVESSRILLTHLGIPVVQAPEEGEAQAAYMAWKGDVWAASSQDFDSLLFGAPRLVRNLTLAGKRKMPGSSRYKEISPEVIELNGVLDHLSITRERLIDLCILMGTDYNTGLSGIGPKKALKLITDHGDLESALSHLGREIEDYQRIREVFLDFERKEDYQLDWRRPDRERVVEFLCEEHDFSLKRVENSLDKIERRWGEWKRAFSQSSLDMF
ncbi:MAG: flap endonuclease-1 [Thermoplasmatota archaeon]